MSPQAGAAGKRNFAAFRRFVSFRNSEPRSEILPRAAAWKYDEIKTGVSARASLQRGLFGCSAAARIKSQQNPVKDLSRRATPILSMLHIE